MQPFGGLILNLRFIQSDGLSGLLCRRAIPLLVASAAKTLVMDHDQLLSGEAPDKLPGHWGAEELLIGPPGHRDLGLSP